MPLIQWFRGHLLVSYSPLGHGLQVLSSRDISKVGDMILGPSLQSFRNKEWSKEYKKGKRGSFDLEELECWESKSRDKRRTLHSWPTSSATGAHDWLSSCHLALLAREKTSPCQASLHHSPSPSLGPATVPPTGPLHRSPVRESAPWPLKVQRCAGARATCGYWQMGL